MRASLVLALLRTDRTILFDLAGSAGGQGHLELFQIVEVTVQVEAEACDLLIIIRIVCVDIVYVNAIFM